MKRRLLLAAAILGLGAMLGAPLAAQGVSDADLAITTKALKAQIVGKTVRTHTYETGQRIEYFAPDGTVYVWPARRNLLIGSWKTCSQEHQIYDVATGTTTPITLATICRTLPKPGGGTQTWNSPGASYLKTVLETAQGDLFGLAALREAPYPMGKRTTDFAYLQRQIAKQR